MFVLTVDQVASRRRRDLVEPALAALAGVQVRLPFTRTVGDEFQGAPEDGLSVVDAILMLMRSGEWHVGLGVGPVEEPLPADPRSARGPAFLAARSAVERAKVEPGGVCVAAAAGAEAEAQDAEVVLHLLGALRERRTAQGWQAVDLMVASENQAEAAAQLGISRQAVGQRLQAAAWTLERRTVPTLARLLERAEAAAAEPGRPA